MRIEKFENSTVLQRGQLLAVARLWTFSHSSLEAELVQVYRHGHGAGSGNWPSKASQIVPAPENNKRAQS
jgi:hypothetical protein